MLVHLRRADNGIHNKLKIDAVETNFGHFSHAEEIHEAIEKLLEVPGMIQMIQEDPGLFIVWDRV